MVYHQLVTSNALGARVCTFEPHPKTFSLMQENASLNGFDGRIHYFLTVLGEQDSRIKFTNIPGSPTNIVLSDSRKSSAMKTIQVTIRRDDTYCQETGIIPEVLKIDVGNSRTKCYREAYFYLVTYITAFVLYRKWFPYEKLRENQPR